MTRRLSVGDAAPAFTLPDARGGEVTLDPSAAAATVVVFTANGCPYALAWHDRIQQVARDYAGRDVTVIQVVSNDETGHPEDSVCSDARSGSRTARSPARTCETGTRRPWPPTARRPPLRCSSSTGKASSNTTALPMPITTILR